MGMFGAQGENAPSVNDPLEASRGRAQWRRFLPHPIAAVVLLIGLAITGGLAAVSHTSYENNEHHLAALQTDLTANILESAPIDVERRLGKAVVVAALTHGSPRFFAQSLSGSMGKAGPFVGAELFRMDGRSPVRVAQLGGALLSSDSSIDASCEKALASKDLVVTRVLRPGAQRLGYAVAEKGPDGGYVAYAEQVLPADRRIPVPKGTESDLYYAVYFGHSRTARSLIETDSSRLPLGGETATTSFAFGTAAITLSGSPRVDLSGAFAASVWWGVVIAGVLISLAAMAIVERLVRRRIAAEVLAAENSRLYHAQRGVAETLQRALLPEQLPTLPGLQVAARYLPGTEGIEVGGDWYDVVQVDERQVFFTVGDVAGRGLEAAVLMTSLRNAINAHATDGDEPGAVLAKIGRLVDVDRDGRFATVLCGLLDVASGDGILVNAGHLPPFLVHAGRATLLETATGQPVGLGEHFAPTLFTMAAGDVLLCCTDGLVERRDEAVTEGLQRLSAAVRPDLDLEALLDDVLSKLVPGGPTDDIALLGLRLG